MRAIVLETSCQRSEVALVDESGIVANRMVSAARKHARELAPTLREMAKSANWPIHSINFIAVDIGPGSYTGLRVGVMTAKTIAFATGAKVVGVDTMAAMAHLAPPAIHRVSCIVDAQQGRVYSAQLYRSASGDFEWEGEISIQPAEAWAAGISEDAWVTGPALSRFGHLVPAGRTVAPTDQRSPTATSLWARALARIHRNEFDDFWTLEPLYLRRSSAETNWDRRRPQQHSQAPTP